MSPRSRASVTFMQIAASLAIIAFVSAVLFPVFQKVRENPHHGSCASNMKQLGLALTQYTQDGDGSFPAGINPVGNGWAGEIYPFIKSSEVYHCPNDIQNGSYVSYAENQNLVKQSFTGMAAPDRTVALYEFTSLGCDPAAAEALSATGLSAPQNSQRHASPNLPYGLNFLAVDGHVKFLTPGQVSGGSNAVRAKALPQGAYVRTFAIK